MWMLDCLSVWQWRSCIINWMNLIHLGLHMPYITYSIDVRGITRKWVICIGIRKAVRTGISEICQAKESGWCFVFVWVWSLYRARSLSKFSTTDAHGQYVGVNMIPVWLASIKKHWYLPISQWYFDFPSLCRTADGQQITDGKPFRGDDVNWSIYWNLPLNSNPISSVLSSGEQSSLSSGFIQWESQINNFPSLVISTPIDNVLLDLLFCKYSHI